MPRENVFLSVMASGSMGYDEIMNFALKCNDKMLYVERTDFDLRLVNRNEDNTRIMDNEYYVSSNSIYNEFPTSKDDTILSMKDNDDKVAMETKAWLHNLTDNGNNQLYIWIDNPTVWSKFISLIFPNANDIVEIPEYIIPYPMDLNSIYQFVFDGRSLDEVYPDLNEPTEFNSLNRVQLTEQITEDIFFKAIPHLASKIELEKFRKQEAEEVSNDGVPENTPEVNTEDK